MLAQALRSTSASVRAFAFVDNADEVTPFFEPGAGVVELCPHQLREADVVGFDGHSDYGTALEVFADRWASAVGPKTSLLVLGDGRTNYRPPGLPVLGDWCAGHTRRTGSIPSRADVGERRLAADRYGEVIDMVECRNAAQLSDFVTTLDHGWPVGCPRPLSSGVVECRRSRPLAAVHASGPGTRAAGATPLLVADRSSAGFRCSAVTEPCLFRWSARCVNASSPAATGSTGQVRPAARGAGRRDPSHLVFGPECRTASRSRSSRAGSGGPG